MIQVTFAKAGQPERWATIRGKKVPMGNPKGKLPPNRTPDAGYRLPFSDWKREFTAGLEVAQRSRYLQGKAPHSLRMPQDSELKAAWRDGLLAGAAASAMIDRGTLSDEDEEQTHSIRVREAESTEYHRARVQGKR